MSSNVIVQYGSYVFSPGPTFTYSRSAEKTPGKDFCLSTPITIELNGNIVPTGSGGNPSGGFTTVTNEITDLSNTFKCGSCDTLLIQCVGSPAFINAPAIVKDLSIQPRNDGDPYVNTASYTISLELPSLTNDDYDNQPSGITSISEDWNLERLDERIGGTANGLYGSSFILNDAYSVSHNVTVTSPFLCKTGVGESNVDGVDTAAAYIRANLLSSPFNGISGIFQPSGLLSLNYYNYYRVINQNVYDGTLTLNETWIASPSGALEEFDVNLEESLDTYLKSVSINGTIQGLSTISYPNANGTPKIQAAFDYFTGVVSGAIYARASTLYDGDTSLNIVPLSRSLGYNSINGTLTYNYQFNDRPANCVANAKSETINVTENEPADVFTSLTIIGRLSGPLNQDVNTVTQRTREISIEAILPVGTGCVASGASFQAPTDYDSFVNDYEAGLTGTYGQVFVTNNTKTWSPKDGRFTFNKAWAIGGC